jgi:hypothetical protein
MIPGARAGNIKQVAFGVIDLLQVCIVTYRLNTFLKRNYLVVASHDHHGPKLQAFGEVHGADRKVTAYGFHIFIENFER